MTPNVNQIRQNLLQISSGKRVHTKIGKTKVTRRSPKYSRDVRVLQSTDSEVIRYDERRVQRNERGGNNTTVRVFPTT